MSTRSEGRVIDMTETTSEASHGLLDKLGELLVRGPLYRRFTYEEKNCHFTNNQAEGHPRFSILPKELKMFCNDEKCSQETWWQTGSPAVHFGSSDRIEERRYTCKNCGKNYQYYNFIWQEGMFIKVGQWPPLSIAVLPELTKALGREDADLYKKALINANFNHGLGAVAYFRRVLENKVNALLDLIAEAAANEQVGAYDLKRIEDVKTSHRVEDKIEVASQLLPASLKPGGHNPLDKLYTLASAGLHGESDEECLDIFSEARFVFEYLFKNLTVSNEEAREYIKRMSSPPKQEP